MQSSATFRIGTKRKLGMGLSSFFRSRVHNSIIYFRILETSAFVYFPKFELPYFDFLIFLFLKIDFMLFDFLTTALSGPTWMRLGSN